MALTAGEQEAARRRARLESDARKVRLVPFGAPPLPPYGTPEFEKTLHDYAIQSTEDSSWMKRAKGMMSPSHDAASSAAM